MTWRLDGPDIAHPYQYTVAPEWTELAQYPLVAHKATEGVSYTDPKFSSAWATMRSIGIPCRGAYHWIRPDSDTIQQADHFIAVVAAAGGLGTGEFVQLDVETTYKQTLHGTYALRAITADEIRAWADHVNAWAGRPCVSRYMGRYHGAYASPLLADVPVWLADYRSEEAWPSPPGTLIRQWGSDGGVAGIRGRCDTNQIEDRAALDQLCGYVIPKNASNQSGGTWSPAGAGGDDVPAYLVTPPAGHLAVFAVYASGTVRHLGPGEFAYLSAVPKLALADVDEYHRLMNASGTDYRD